MKTLFLTFLVFIWLEASAIETNIVVNLNDTDNISVTYINEKDSGYLILNNNEIISLENGKGQLLHLNKNSYFKSYPVIFDFNDSSFLLNKQSLLPLYYISLNGKNKIRITNTTVKYITNEKTEDLGDYLFVKKSNSYLINDTEVFIDSHFSDIDSKIIQDKLSKDILFYNNLFSTKINAKKVFITFGESTNSEGHVYKDLLFVRLSKKVGFGDFLTLSHEVAHFYLQNYSQETSKWITEGLPEYLAYLVYSQNSHEPLLFGDFVTEQFESCKIKISGLTIQQLENSSAIYPCGIVAHALYMSPSFEKTKEFFDILFSNENRYYNNSSFFEALVKYKGEKLSNILKEMIKTESLHSFLKEYKNDFTQYEISIVQTKESIRINGLNAFAEIMKQNCGFISFFPEKHGVKLLNDCEALKSLNYIKRINGYSITAEGDKVFDSVAERCITGNLIALEGDKKIQLPCNQLNLLKKETLKFTYMKGNY